jgi:hypothetical protein
MKIYHSASLILVVSILIGCASGSTKIDSRVQSSSIPSFKKILVHLNVESRNFNKDIVSGLQASLASSLATCGITSSTYVRDPLDINSKQTLAQRMNDFKPDAVLAITRTGGQILIGEGGNQAEFDVMMRLRQTTPLLEVWTAKSDVRVLTQNIFTNDVKSGEKLGVKFFEVMKKDRVICQDMS